MIRTLISGDLVADPVQMTSITPSPCRRTAGPENPKGGDTLDDLPDSSYLNSMEA